MRDGDARRIAADIVSDVCRASKGCLGVADPLFGIELIATLCNARREGQGAGGACLGQRRAERATQDWAQGPPRQEEAGIGIDPVRAVSGECPGRDDAVDMEMRPSGLVPSR